MLIITAPSWLYQDFLADSTLLKDFQSAKN